MNKPVSKVRTAIIGCGNISNIYCKNLCNMLSIIDLVAVCDLNREAARVRAAQYNLKIMTMEEICNDSSIELVVNLTGPGAHYVIVKNCYRLASMSTPKSPYASASSRVRSFAALPKKIRFILVWLRIPS